MSTRRTTNPRHPAGICFEDAHLLAVNKPPGVNTHASSPFASEGIYDWLRHRASEWADLAIVHRLDKDTSGVLVFAKSRAACQSLTRQFEARTVRKRYLFLTDRVVPHDFVTRESQLERLGDRYQSQPVAGPASAALTRFRKLRATSAQTLVEAVPLTGRTHQIRVHAADLGFPILGDVRYGGTPAPRLYLHAEQLSFLHPASNTPLTLEAPADFAADARLLLRDVFCGRGTITITDTNSAYRLIHGAADARPGWYVDRLGEYLLSQAARPLTVEELAELGRMLDTLRLQGAYHKTRARSVRETSANRRAPELLHGSPAAHPLVVLENGLRFELNLDEGYSHGLFLDQRDNRFRLLTNHVAAAFPVAPGSLAGRRVLNTFAYTCAFSVCAARAGAHVTSVDLSRRYLDWGRRNFELNQLNPEPHEFLVGDTSEWFRRLARARRRFDLIIIDPPTFATSKAGGAFRVEKDLPRLVLAALELLGDAGVMLMSSNAARWPADAFTATILEVIGASRRKLERSHYAPPPPDFPITRSELGAFKSLWCQIR